MMRNFRVLRIISALLMTTIIVATVVNPAYARSFDRINQEIAIGSQEDDDLYSVVKIELYELSQVEVDDSNSGPEYMVEVRVEFNMAINASDFANITFEFPDELVAYEFTISLEEVQNPFEYVQDTYEDNTKLSMRFFHNQNNIQSVTEGIYSQQLIFAEPSEEMEIMVHSAYHWSNGTVLADSSSFTMTDMNYGNNIAETPVSTIGILIGLLGLGILVRFRK